MNNHTTDRPRPQRAACCPQRESGYCRRSGRAGSGSGVPLVCAGMQLRSQQLAIDPNDPTKADLLGRRAQVHALCSLIDETQGPATIAVRGAAGEGKTTLLRMTAAQLRTLGCLVAELDAGLAEYTSPPVDGIIAALYPDLEWGAEFHRLAQDLLWPPRYRRPDLLTERSRREWHASLDLRGGLHTELAKRLDGGKKLVVLIDNLAHCRPSYAAEIIGTARRVFDAPGVIFVAAATTPDLDEHLTDFDFWIRLRPWRQPETLERFLDATAEAAEASRWLGTSSEQPAGRILRSTAARCELSLTQTQQMVHSAAASMSFLAQTDSDDDEAEQVRSYAVVALHALRAADPAIYRGLREGQIPPAVAAKSLVEALGASDPMADLGAAMLLLIAVAGGSSPGDIDRELATWRPGTPTGAIERISGRVGELFRYAQQVARWFDALGDLIG